MWQISTDGQTPYDSKDRVMQSVARVKTELTPVQSVSSVASYDIWLLAR